MSYTKTLSERHLAKKTGLARETIRKCLSEPQACKLSNIQAVALALDQQIVFAVVPSSDCESEMSVVAVSSAMHRDGFDSWKIHLFNFVDSFRRSRDERLILLPPIASLDIRLRALFQAVVVALVEELKINEPAWTKRPIFLDEPWFVSGVESLKAFALLESPYMFRRHNIFVLKNFLSRA